MAPPKQSAATRKAKKKADDEAAEAARTAKKEALRAKLKEKSFNLLAEVLFDIDTYTFDYRVEKPSTKPAPNRHEAVDPDKTPQELELCTKPSKDKIEGDAYDLNFTSKQNCDAMLRHLYGEEREDTDCCDKYKSPHKHKRKAGGGDSDGDDDDRNNSDLFEELDARICKVLAGVFWAATDRKKKQKTKK
ncbi:hypothetical protein NM208_g4860 [Fusarium decemcellulare]|uniref:Uncharacterized protein n=2 Tax=Fusarium decemcellulare TaxID=57161 RepID=A0ACC1S662_9HYPO|nr:hypothetical protein NM208_g8226 [Fusarium decemcellulare]KAJ3540874.1 hypothetical protein NM208_g4860 [Fusarium decemcellulare]